MSYSGHQYANHQYSNLDNILCKEQKSAVQWSGNMSDELANQICLKGQDNPVAKVLCCEIMDGVLWEPQREGAV